mmetsp:Transcript_9746/g.24246  ORF Transcript_9746/g.24246 Transcript_9746/m.24246 type:complete len:271 (+) Transcript_9746:99-911(+)
MHASRPIIQHVLAQQGRRQTPPGLSRATTTHYALARFPHMTLMYAPYAALAVRSPTSPRLPACTTPCSASLARDRLAACSPSSLEHRLSSANAASYTTRSTGLASICTSASTAPLFTIMGLGLITVGAEPAGLPAASVSATCPADAACTSASADQRCASGAALLPSCLISASTRSSLNMISRPLGLWLSHAATRAPLVASFTLPRSSQPLTVRDVSPRLPSCTAASVPSAWHASSQCGLSSASACSVSISRLRPLRSANWLGPFSPRFIT